MTVLSYQQTEFLSRSRNRATKVSAPWSRRTCKAKCALSLEKVLFRYKEESNRCERLAPQTHVKCPPRNVHRTTSEAHTTFSDAYREHNGKDCGCCRGFTLAGGVLQTVVHAFAWKANSQRSVDV